MSIPRLQYNKTQPTDQPRRTEEERLASVTISTQFRGALGGLSGQAAVEFHDGGALLPVEAIREDRLNPPAAQVYASLGGLGPILAGGRGPDSPRPGRPSRGGLVPGVVRIGRNIPGPRAGQHPE